ncbi:hypothetical protein MY5147_008697 [Beauveria neobassiana]
MDEPMLDGSMMAGSLMDESMLDVSQTSQDETVQVMDAMHNLNGRQTPESVGSPICCPGNGFNIDLSGDYTLAVEDISSTSVITSQYQRRSSVKSNSPRKYNAIRSDDGLFHCQWEGCKHKPEKLKCNYEHIDSHVKPYECKSAGCEDARFSSNACLLRHEREAHGCYGHGQKPFFCSYEGYTGERPYQCVLCGDTFSRSDILKRHFNKCSIRRGNPTGASHLSHPIPVQDGMNGMPSDQRQLSRSSSMGRVDSPANGDRRGSQSNRGVVNSTNGQNMHGYDDPVLSYYS